MRPTRRSAPKVTVTRDGGGKCPVAPKAVLPVLLGSVNRKAAARAIPKWGSADTSRVCRTPVRGSCRSAWDPFGGGPGCAGCGERVNFQAAERCVVMVFVCRSIWRAKSNERIELLVERAEL